MVMMVIIFAYPLKISSDSLLFLREELQGMLFAVEPVSFVLRSEFIGSINSKFERKR
jgi:hypothetical protein